MTADPNGDSVQVTLRFQIHPVTWIAVTGLSVLATSALVATGSTRFLAAAFIGLFFPGFLALASWLQTGWELEAVASDINRHLQQRAT